MPAVVPLPNYRPGHISGYVPRETPFVDRLLASILTSAASSATNQFIDDLITTKSEKTQNEYMQSLMENQALQKQLQELNLSEAKGKRDQELAFYINSLIEGLSGREGLGPGSDELYKYAWDRAQNMEGGSIYGPDYRKELQEWTNDYLSSQGQGDTSKKDEGKADLFDIVGNVLGNEGMEGKMDWAVPPKESMPTTIADLPQAYGPSAAGQEPLEEMTAADAFIPGSKKKIVTPWGVIEVPESRFKK